MIVIHGSVPIRTEAHDRVASMLRELAAKSRQEAGCVEYAFSFDVENADLVHVNEVWASVEAMGAHLQQPHVQAFLGSLGEIAAGAPVVTRYDVASSGPLF
jgi:quinol monooxygenase YgiN